MPIAAFEAVNPTLLDAPGGPFAPMIRIDSVGASVPEVSAALVEHSPQKTVYAEGDSWFDKFTPIPPSGTNLLDAIQTPFRTAVVDVSHIGDEARDLASGRQARQTKAMFDALDFDAVLLSAGGNDLKNVFADLFASKALAEAGLATRFSADQLQRIATPASYAEFFEGVIESIRAFVGLRDAARRERTRAAPIFLHGYDYLQPRDAGAELFAGSRIGGGPWIWPSLRDAGLGDAEMRSAADAVVDELNRQLRDQVAPLAGVFLIDQRGLLIPGAAGSTGDSNDWLDEIHPNKRGFVKLARNRWNAPLSQALGWQPQAGEVVAPIDPTTVSTAFAGARAPVG